MKIETVIGANYGDEGKGMFTEYLCRNRPKPVVVLSNGGCQRGHTVNHPETGIRHIFNHFGSGTLLNKPTVFSRTFLLNPIKFTEEYKKLSKIGLKPVSARTPGCIFQLPSDMFINQQLELQREKTNTRHGSCGWGIWETTLRNRAGKLTFETFMAMDDWAKSKLLRETAERQVVERLDGKFDGALYRTMTSPGFIAHFLEDCRFMKKTCPALLKDDLLDAGIDAETMIVENAQGLLLDVEYAPKDAGGKTDAHTTPSRTGMAGVLDALGGQVKAKDVTANYISRSYLTRHGAGPFPEFDGRLSFKDKTNVPNEWQGTMRFGAFDAKAIDDLKSRILKDLEGANCALVVTHLNETHVSALEYAATYLSYEDDSSKIIKKIR